MNVIQDNRRVIIGVIAALVVGLLLGFGAGRQTAGSGDENMVMTKEATSPATTTHRMGESGSATAGVMAEGNSVSVSDQPAGMSVEVGSVTLTEEGWVAVRDASGRTLGAALFPVGTHTNASVPLLRATEAGQSYQALIYFDDGTKTFNLKTETVVLGADGSVAGTTFTVK